MKKKEKKMPREKGGKTLQNKGTVPKVRGPHVCKNLLVG